MRDRARDRARDFDGRLVGHDGSDDVILTYGFADFYSNLAALLSKAWFHGSVQTSDAEHRLADRAEGCFLIRFSTTSPGSYTISKVKKGGAPVHQRIEHKNGAFHVATRSYPNLELLLQGEYENLGLKGACPGSKYNAIFADVAAQGSFYVEANE